MSDVKQKHQQKLIERKLQEEKNLQEKKYIDFVMKGRKYDWRKSINEQMTTADVFYTNLPAEGEVDLVSTDVSINFSGGTPGEIGSPSEGFYARTTTIGPVDTSRYDTIGITVTVNSSIDYGEGLILTSGSGLSGATVILSPGSTSGTYYSRLPSSSSASSYRLVQIVSSTGSSTFTINKISYQRRNPKNVFVSLDSPEAASFIRTDPAFAGLSEEEKKQKLKEMLEASDEYVMKMFGENFPGSGAVPPGESGDTPGVQVTDVQLPQETQISQEIEKSVATYQNSLDDFENAFNDLKNDLKTKTSVKSGIFTKQQSDAFMKGWNQGRAEQGLPPMDNMGRTISTNNSSTSISKSADQRAIDTLKKEIETRTKLQTTGDAQKYYSSPSMQKALDRLKVNLAQQEKDFADKYGSTEMPGPDPQELEKQLSDIDKQIADLRAQAKQNMIDARNNEWKAAAVAGASILAGTAVLGALVSSTAVAVPSAAARVQAALNALKKSADVTKALKQIGRSSMGQNVKGTGMGDRWSPNVYYNSYEPEGQLITEKKKLKSPQEVLDKIPGYYDGKA